LSLKALFLFVSLSAILSVPAVMQVQCPIDGGTGRIVVPVIGMENIRLTGLSTKLVNVVRLGCGAYAVYSVNYTLTFSNAASFPINSTTLVVSSYNSSGSVISRDPIFAVIPANTTGFAVKFQLGLQVSIQNAAILPALAYSGTVLEASNGTVTAPDPFCDGKGTVTLLRALTWELSHNANRTAAP
jgi:hypothetical protein